jgi:hypothetical protein
MRNGKVFLLALAMLIVFAIVAALVSCAALKKGAGSSGLHHPDSLNQFDDYLKDQVIVSQSVLDQARNEYDLGNLPEATVPVYNQAVDVYNAVLLGGQNYEKTVRAGGDAMALELAINSDIQELAGLIVQIRAAFSSKSAKMPAHPAAPAPKIVPK